MDNEQHLPANSIKEYRNSPVIDETLEAQIVYWKRRAKFFENKAYGLREQLREETDDNSGEWWKRDE